MSYPPTWLVGDTESERNNVRDSTSILSSGYRSILDSTNSVENGEISQAQNLDDLAKALENHEEKASSQGSDDSSTFSESAPTTHYGRGSNFNQISSPQGSGSFSFSSAEGTPVRTMSETRKRHPGRQTDPRKHLVSSVSDTSAAAHARSPRPRSSPHSSAHSSISGVTLSSQSSLGEEGINPDASERKSRHKMKYGKYEKYERSSHDKHETRDRSKSLDTSPNLSRKKVEGESTNVPSDNEPSQELLTQESNGTLTDGNLESTVEVLTEVELSSSHSVASMDSFYQNVGSQSAVVSDATKNEHTSSEQDRGRESGEEKEEVSDVVRDDKKTHDSGIDDTNSPVYKNSEPRESSLCDEDDELHLRDGSKPASYKLVFASRDSMLTDSPDTDSLNDDYVNSKIHSASSQQTQKTSAQHQGKPSSSLDRQSRATSEGSEPSVGSPAHVELIIEDGKPARIYEQDPQPLISRNPGNDILNDLGPGVLTVSDDDDEDSLHEFERSSSSVTGPRSLEGPAFSKYARVPIRSTESKTHIRVTDNPLYDTSSSNLRQRACSLNDLDEVSPSASEEEEKEEKRNKRATSESRATPKSMTPIHSATSVHTNPDTLQGLPQSSSSIDLQSRGGSQEGESCDAIRDKALGGSLRMEKKHKKGKGFVSKLKPALRVLKITPSSSVGSKKSQAKLEKIRAQEASMEGNSPADYLTPVPIPRPYEEVKRMRMMSPEVMSTLDDSPPVGMRRSHSSDDILDRSSDNSMDISVGATQAGSVYVIPEATKSKRRRFFQSKSKDRSRSRESSASPVVLVDYQPRTRRVSVEPVGNPSSTNGIGTIDMNHQKSPKSIAKRRRLPHFV